MSAILTASLLLGGCRPAESDQPEAEVERVGVDVWSRFTGVPDRIAQMLKPRQSPLQVFTPSLSDEARAASDKLKQSAQRDPYLFLTLVRDNTPEGVPRFDPRWGISQDEFDLLMRGGHYRLKKISDGAIRIERNLDDRYVIHGLPSLTQVTIDAALQVVTTPYGEVSRPAQFDPSESAGFIGRSAGYRWTQPPVAGVLRRYEIEELTLAQSQDDGAVWVIVHIGDTRDKRRVADYFARLHGPSE